VKVEINTREQAQVFRAIFSTAWRSVAHRRVKASLTSRLAGD
jgi:hypothetical protein